MSYVRISHGFATLAFVLMLSICGDVLVGACAAEKQHSVKAVALPHARDFKEIDSEDFDPAILSKVGRWMSDRESDFLTNDHEMVVTGEFSRNIRLKSGSIAIWMSFRANETQRIRHSRVESDSAPYELTSLPQ